MTPWHSDVFGIVSVHLALLSHSPPAICSTVIVDSWLPRAKLCCFSAKPDRCDSRSRRSDGSRCCSCASMNFNTFARWIFLRLPRSYRVVEKSDPIGSREPNYAVFQQIPTVVTTDLDAPMDPGAVIAQAWTSMYLLGVYFSVCRDRTALRRNPTRSLASRDPIAENHEKSMVFIEFFDDATRSSQTEKTPRAKCIDGWALNL